MGINVYWDELYDDSQAEVPPEDDIVPISSHTDVKHDEEQNLAEIPTPTPPPIEFGIYSEASSVPQDHRAQVVIDPSYDCFHERETRNSNQEDMTFHWKNCYSTISEYGSKTTSAWTEEMNTVLIFGALYSALVSAFLAVSYQFLREDPASNSTSLNSSFTPTSSDVAINVVWFSSLVLSLTAVLMALLVKQWLFHYTWTTDISLTQPRTATGLRHLLLTSQNGDRVFLRTIAHPSVLLIVSLFLFFTGLIIFLWTLNFIVAGVITVLTSFTVIYFIATTLAPALDPTSMYRSSQAWYLYRAWSACRSVFTGEPVKTVDTWTKMSLEHLDSAKDEYLSRALLWVHRRFVAWDRPRIRSAWKCARSLKDSVASKLLSHFYLHDPPTSGDDTKRFLTKEYPDTWRRWIGSEEIQEMYELLLRTFPNTSKVTMILQVPNGDHINALCSLHFGIEYHHERALTIFTGLNKLAGLLLPLAVSPSTSLVKEDGTQHSVVNAQGIAYTLNFAMTTHWHGGTPLEKNIPVSQEVTHLLSTLVAVVGSSVRRAYLIEKTSSTAFFYSVSAAINVAHFKATQLGGLGLDEQCEVFEMLGAMGVFLASADVQEDHKWRFLNAWAPTLFRYNGNSVWEMWADYPQLRASMKNLLAKFASLESVQLVSYNPGDPTAILMLYMLYGNSDQRCLVYHKAASLAGADDNGYTGDRWWQERLTPSELHYVTHALVDVPPATCEDGNAKSDESCFAVLCTLLAASPTTDDELLNKIRSLFATRINECLSGTSPNDLRARANIHSWSQTLVQIFSDSNTRDLQLALIPKILPDLIRYAKSNHTSDEGITDVFISSSAVAMQLGCRITYSDDILDDMKKLVALMRESIEGNDNNSADDARQRWKKVIEVIAQSQGVHQLDLGDPYVLLVQSLTSQS